MEDLNIENVVSVIDQALDMAARKGVFGLKDATVVNQALTLLKTHLGIKEPVPTPEPVTTPSK